MMIQTRKMMIGLHIPSLGLHIPSHIDRSLRELAAPASPQHRERGLLRDSILLYFLEWLKKRYKQKLAFEEFSILLLV